MIRSEEIEQARFIKWSHLPAVRAVLPELQWLHHSPNGGKRDAFTGAQMKALGVKAGFPDLILPVPSRSRFGLAIEMKSATGRVTPAQQDWLNTLSGYGWACEVCRSAADARMIVCCYFGVSSDALPPIPEK